MLLNELIQYLDQKGFVGCLILPLSYSSSSPSVDAWSVAFSPDSKHIATGSHHGKVNIFGVESGKKEYSLDTRGKFILSIAYVRNDYL